MQTTLILSRRKKILILSIQKTKNTDFSKIKTETVQKILNLTRKATGILALLAIDIAKKQPTKRKADDRIPGLMSAFKPNYLRSALVTPGQFAVKHLSYVVKGTR